MLFNNHDKKNNEIILIEVGITNLDLLTQVENEKLRKYDLIANELALMYKCKVKIFPYVMTWDGLVTKYHKKYVNEIGLQTKTETYIQSLVLRKTLESISFERRRGLEEELDQEEAITMRERLIDKCSKQDKTLQRNKRQINVTHFWTRRYIENVLLLKNHAIH